MRNKKYNLADLEKLNDMQRYLGEETIGDYQSGEMSRRGMLRRLLLICGSASGVAALLAACGDATVTPTIPSTAAATAANAPVTTAPATTAPPTTAAITTAPATTSAATTAASGTTAAGGVKSPLSVAADNPAIQASDVTFPSDTTIMGYLVKPKGTGPFPGVIVVHENRGLTDHIKDVTRRVAKAGYIALAPDLMSRNGGTAKFTPDQIAGMLAQAKPEDLVKDLNSGVTFLGGQPDLKTGKLGVIGFCFGGGYTLRLAAANPKILAAIPYYGPVPNPPTIMSTTNAAILGQYGANDNFVNPGIPGLEKVMLDNNKIYQKKIYEGAGHAFNNDTGTSYNEKASLEAWTSTLDWFNKYLKS